MFSHSLYLGVSRQLVSLIEVSLLFIEISSLLLHLHLFRHSNSCRTDLLVFLATFLHPSLRSSLLDPRIDLA